jgi:hypothetical protein
MKKYDIAYKTGTYTGNDGTEKGRYENFGEIHSNDNGHYARLNVTRLLGICHLAIAKGQDSVLVSLFAPRTDTAAPTHHPTPTPTHYPAPTAKPAPMPTVGQDFNDDIPF